MKARMVVLVIVSVLLAACGGGAADTSTGTKAKGGETEGGLKDHKVKNFAMILPGPVSDADYNAVGLQTVEAVEKELGIETSYSEKVQVVDAERIARDYIRRDFTTISFHGTQYLSIAQGLAPSHPDVLFIVESAAQVPDLPNNVFNLGRTYIGGYYALGQLAASVSKVGRIAFLGGLDIPDFKGGANSAYEGAKQVNPDIKMTHAFTGDQNDPVKARQSAQALLGQGADVLLVSLNGGLPGAVQAVKSADRPVLFTSLHTDKHSLAPTSFLASMEFNYQKVYPQILRDINSGKKDVYLEMKPSNDGVTFSDVYNVSEEQKAKFNEIVQGLVSGQVEPPKVTLSEVTIPKS